jgi:hypothetical protein
MTLPSAEHPACPAFIKAGEALNEAIGLLSAEGESLALADCGPTGVLLLKTRRSGDGTATAYFDSPACRLARRS